VSRLVITAVAVAAASLLLTASAHAQTASCGQVLTEDTTLEADLVDCPVDGLVVGADGITIDMNGHSIVGRHPAGGSCWVDCLGHDGIESRGFDRLTIKNGTLDYFEHDINLSGTQHSSLSNLHLRGGVFDQPAVGLLLLHADGNRIDGVNADGGSIAILLWGSRRNAIAGSIAAGHGDIRVGSGLLMVAGSNGNRVIDTRVDGNDTGLLIAGDRNRVARSHVDTYLSNRLAGDHNVLVDNDLDGGRLASLVMDGQRNLLARNSFHGRDGVYVSGNRNRIQANAVSGTSFDSMGIGPGNANVVRANTFAGGERSGLRVFVGATRTAVIGNLATGVYGDGFRIDAPGTVVGRNTANDNGNLGINAVEGVIDAGGNLASGNGNPLQCVNVFCQ
jgi:Right handed beta helix region